MRRAIAVLLMLVFSSMLIAPVLAADPEASLPACCRRHGKHHCAMRMAVQPGSRTGFTTVKGKCPCFPAGTTAVRSWQFRPELDPSLACGWLRGPFTAAPAQSGFPFTFRRGHPKRGPPAPLA
jgi:hypothetical protein